MLRLKKIATGTTGSEIAEAALVLPIFFLIMLGIYWFGRAFNTVLPPSITPPGRAPERPWRRPAPPVAAPTSR